MSRLLACFRVDPLSLFIGGFAVFFFLIAAAYSAGYMRGRGRLTAYYGALTLTLLASLGAVFADHLVVFLAFWGLLALLLYQLIGFGGAERAPETARRALIIVGGSDALMMLGLALAWRLTGSLEMSAMRVPIDSGAALAAYLCLAAGAFAKAGAMPFHSWIPDTAEDAPVPVTAFLPASLDKLLGIYFLARISLTVFVMSPAANAILMIAGSLTIMAAVMMALVQHDLKRLLGYHAVSQVGYMVLGIGSGNPVGIAGGLFHMLNNAVYKSALFLGAGAVEKAAGTTDLERLGGLGRAMPVTFGAFLVAALAISGVPPLNGFASKWMIYQGVVESGRGGGVLWVLCLLAAMFGSALTLASFMKVIHAVFLGRPSPEAPKAVREAGPALRLPAAALALLCVVFGVLARPVPLRWFIFPSLGGETVFPGLWNAGLAAGLLLAGLGIGLLIFRLGSGAPARETDVFVGGEPIDDHPDMRLSGADFYRTISDLGSLSAVYDLAARRRLDPYDAGARAAHGLTRALRRLHNGVLPTYLAWCLLGATALLLALLG